MSEPNLFNLASDPNTPPWKLEQLSTNKHIFVRSRVARNPNTPVIVLERQVRDSSMVVRYCLVLNPRSTPNMLESLVDSVNQNPWDLYAIAKHPNVTQRIKNYLMAKIYVNNI